jgi:hypothetical protein
VLRIFDSFVLLDSAWYVLFSDPPVNIGETTGEDSKQGRPLAFKRLLKVAAVCESGFQMFPKLPIVHGVAGIVAFKNGLCGFPDE